jgi:hypothetical protein
MDSIFFKNISINYDMDTGEEQRTVMGRDIVVLKNKGRVQENYHYTDTYQPHIGLVKDPAKSVLKYDKHGRLLEYFAFFTNGEPRTKDLYTYALSGLKGEVSAFYIPENKLSNTSKLTLDHNYNIVKTESYTVGLDSPLVIEYTYNKRNQIIQEEFRSAGGRLTTLYNHKYDKVGNLVENRMTFVRQGKPDNTKLTTYSYEGYDSHHNWLIQNAYTDGKLRSRIERRITYHQ